MRFQLPGLDRDDIELLSDRRELVVRGERRFPGGEHRVYQQVEMDYGTFERRVRLMVDVEPETTAREMDSQFEWVAHEPEALKEGVPQSTIDVIKYRRSTEGLDDTDALIIELGRQLWRDHKVKSETFAKLKAIFGPNKLVELVMLMGNYAGTAALLAAVDMQLHAGKKPLLPIP